MPHPLELASTAAMLSFIFAGVRYLRETQPDPNPAIEAREAQAESARRNAEGAPTLVPAPEERRYEQLPYVGADRRAEMIREAAAFRRSV